MEAGVRRLLLLAGAVVFVDTTLFAAVVPILPGLAQELGLSKAGAGVLTGAFAAGTLLASLPAGWLAMRIGVRATVLVGLGLMAGSSLAFAFAQDVWVLDLARFVQGVGSAASWAGALAWLIGAAPTERRGELIGSAMAAAIAGALFGPALGAGAEAIGRGPAFALIAAAGLALMAVALRVPAPRIAAVQGATPVRAALADGRVAGGFWLVLLPSMTFGVIDVLVPLRLDVLGAGAFGIAAVFLVAASLEAVVSPIAGRVSDRVGRVLPSTVALAGTALVLALLALPEAAWLVAALLIALGPAIGIIWAPAIALLSDAAEARGVHQAFAFGLTNLAWASGALLGSAGGAAVGEGLGDAAAYLTISALCLLTLAVLMKMPQEATASLGSSSSESSSTASPR
jgi:MFS family permease